MYVCVCMWQCQKADEKKWVGKKCSTTYPFDRDRGGGGGSDAILAMSIWTEHISKRGFPNMGKLMLEMLLHPKMS